MTQQLPTDIIGYAAAATGAILFFPQAIQIWRTKETKAISLASFAIMAFGTLLWITYGLLTHTMPVVLVNIAILCLSVFIILMKLKYK